ncbi:MAG: mechanosensitive ion channel domain-containing protein [Promethearchaeota archaeon]
MLLFISPTFTIAIISFLLIAISLTFSDIINNIASGIILISKEDVEIGDLVEINNIQGIVQEINLNYTIIKELDGVLTYIPNKNVYNASVVKFTHRREKELELFKDRKDIKKNIKEFSKLITKGERRTIFTKSVEILSTINPENLDNLLSPVFDKYEHLFGQRPDYLVDTTTFDRLRIILVIMAKSPNLVLEYIDAFLRDILYKLYPNEIFIGWRFGEQSNSKTNIGGE